MKKILKFFVALNILLAVVTLLAYLSPYANPKYLWPISVLAVFYPWLLLMNILAVIFWMFNKLRYSIISILVIALGFNHLNGFIGISSAGYKSSAEQIEILSYNTQNLYYIYGLENGRAERAKTFFNFIKSQKDVDIICTQEIGTRSLESWRKNMNFSHSYAPEKVGPVIFSKHPIVNKGQFYSSTSTVNSCIWADVNIRGNTYRIYNLHMQSNKITRTAERVIEDAKLQNKETWNGVKSIVNRYKDNATYRIEHAERIRTHMQESPYPILLAGDFNDVPQSYLYHILSREMQDSFQKQGFGLGTTFAGKIPALRIDYILADDSFDILNHEILKVDFSDHFPIKSIVKLKDQP